MANVKKSIVLPKPQLAGWLKNLLVGLVGGLLGSFLIVVVLSDYLRLDGSVSERVILEESSAIIKIAEEVGPTVVNIATEITQADLFGRRQRVPAGAGSGIIISSDGLILTNKHLVSDDSSRITVTT